MTLGGEAIVSAEWLQEKLSSGLILLDVSWYSDKDANEDYKKKHIPGARRFELMQGVTNTSLHPRNIPSAEIFQAQVRELGINDDSRVVVYDGTGKGGFFIGSRAWWTFKLFGLEKVSILDGGLQKWEEKGFPVTSAEEPKPNPGNFTSKRQDSWIKTYDQMKENLTSPAYQVFDSRADKIYTGNAEDPKSGHYPGAVNIPFEANLINKETLTFKTPDQLKEVLSGMGMDLEKPTVTMCNSGMSSCSLLLAAHVVGAKDVSLFHGGMNEWKNKSPEDVVQGSK